MAAIPPQGEVVTISPADFGSGKMAALDRWGTSFVWWAGAWIILVGSALLVYFLANLPKLPSTANLSPDQVRDVVATHQALTESLQRSVGNVFDLLVTKTALPVVTLMLGYLFGKRQG
jgi:hypothetical protein